MKEASFNIAGMTCAHCVRAVTNSLLALPGVREAVVNLDAGTARVVYEELSASPEDLIAAISDAGYELA